MVDPVARLDTHGEAVAAFSLLSERPRTADSPVDANGSKAPSEISWNDHAPRGRIGQRFAIEHAPRSSEDPQRRILRHRGKRRAIVERRVAVGVFTIGDVQWRSGLEREVR